MSRIIITAVTAVVSVALTVFSGERRPISGDVRGELEPGAYIVKATVTVPEEDSLLILAGTVIYFDSLTGINVGGTLTIAGTSASPVVLTSVNDTAASPVPPQAFDWNGIKAQGPSAALRLRHAGIQHSVYGVSVRDTEAKVELDSVVFDNNGYASLVRGEEIVPVRAGEPFCAKWNAAEAPPPVKKPACRHQTRFRLIFNASAAGVAAAGVTLCAVNLVQMNTYFDNYSKGGNSKRLSSYYEDRVRGNITMSAVGAAAAGVGLGCLAVSLFF